MILLPILHNTFVGYQKEEMGLEAGDYSDSYNKRVWVNPNLICTITSDIVDENYSNITMANGNDYICAYDIDKLIKKINQAKDLA